MKININLKLTDMKNLIQNNMNLNGGGLAVNITGRYESNRKALADMNEEKRTAGQVAQSLRKKGHSIKANDIKEFCEEWHHAGFVPKKGMGRTFYTKKSDEKILKEFNEEQKRLKIASQTKISGFYYTWEREYTGSYGKKRNYKVCHFFEGTELQVPRNFTECTREEFEASSLYEGQKFYEWDEPHL